jgi:diguanylate cyclase (GGDEF)-like protein
MATLADTPINPLTLTFADRALESDFRADRRGQSPAPIRISLAASLALYILLGLLDWTLAREAYRSIWVYRYALVCPILGGMLLLSFAPFFKRFHSAILVVGAGGAAIGLILIVFSVHPSESGPYFLVLCLHLVFCCLFLGLRFPVAVGLCVVLGMAYGLVGLASAASASSLPRESALLGVSAILGLAAGYGVDYSRRAAFLQRRRLDRQTDELNRAQEEAQQKRQELDALTRVDALTGLATRGHFFEIAERDLDRCRRYAHPLAVIILDLDHFKVVNDTFGHLTGDWVLQAVSGQILVNVREADTACRFGGEEFAVVLPETNREAAQQVGERLRGFIESLRIEAPIGRLSVTVSAGIAATAAQETTTLDDLLACADRALLAAKKAGRNRVSVWEAIPAPEQ